MLAITTSLLETIALEVAQEELPIVIKWIKTLETKVPAIGLKHLALAEIASLLQDLDNDINPTGQEPVTPVATPAI
jgi:hypothetical protein